MRVTCFIHPAQAAASFHQGKQRKCPTPYLKDNAEEKTEVHQEQVYEVPKIELYTHPYVHQYYHTFQKYLLEC